MFYNTRPNPEALIQLQKQESNYFKFMRSVALILPQDMVLVSLFQS